MSISNTESILYPSSNQIIQEKTLKTSEDFTSVQRERRERMLFTIKNIQNGFFSCDQLEQLKDLGITDIEMRQLENMRVGLKGGMMRGGPTSEGIDLPMIQRSICEVDQKVSHIAGKNGVLILGLTGAGKSTLLNYLYRKEITKQRVPGSPQPQLKVISPLSEVSAGMTSKTFLPVIPGQQLEGFPSVAFCDCPGFLDTRGATHNIINIYAINNMLLHAGSLQHLFVVIEYNSINLQRGEGMRKSMEETLKFFKEGKIPFDNISFIITKTPPKLSHEQLHQKIAEVYGDMGKMHPLIQQLQQTAIKYDPLDDGTSRKMIMEKVQRSSLIKHPQEIIQTTIDLDSTTRTAILEEADRLVSSIQRDLHEKNYSNMILYLNTLRILEECPGCDAGRYRYSIEVIQKELQAVVSDPHADYVQQPAKAHQLKQEMQRLLELSRMHRHPLNIEMLQSLISSRLTGFQKAAHTEDKTAKLQVENKRKKEQIERIRAQRERLQRFRTQGMPQPLETTGRALLPKINHLISLGQTQQATKEIIDLYKRGYKTSIQELAETQEISKLTTELKSNSEGQSVLKFLQSVKKESG